ncbi:helix-turn-helix domain-containing protein [Dongia sp.]|uniref:helix-turn-helix domain-containing protein n=1 Tax=Dongia sp. TaxID=1977262 RepID=UPI0035B1C4D1
MRRNWGAIKACALRHRKQLKQTFHCYFNSQYTVKSAAETLGRHANALRQRLETLRKIAGGWDGLVKSPGFHVALWINAILT